MIGGNKTSVSIESSEKAKAAGRDYHEGISVEEHRELMNEQIERLEAKNAKIIDLLKRTHNAEKHDLERQQAELQQQLEVYRQRANNPEQSLKEMKARIDELEGLLEHSTVEIGENRLKSAHDAMARGDFSEADQIFAEVQEHEQRAVERYAEAAYGQGLIAEQEVRWHDAAEHYVRACRIHETDERLEKAGTFLWRAGRNGEAIHYKERRVTLLRTKSGAPDPVFASAQNNLATSYRAMGLYDEAEPLFREAMEIVKVTIGETHPEYATHLSNLACLLQIMGRYDEAEPLHRQAIEIDKATVGEAHPDYAIHLNNLAALLRDMGRLGEAESLFRQAIEIDKATIGEIHPDYAIHLNNLALLLGAMGRHGEAEPLFRQAIDIDKATIGDTHPKYGQGLVNFGVFLAGKAEVSNARESFDTGVKVWRNAIGDNSPETKIPAGLYARFLREHFPDDPALAELEATFGPDIGK